MALHIERFSTVAAAGVSNGVVQHTFLNGTVTRVHLFVPNGHAGFTAWSLWFGAQQLIPFTSGATVVANNREFDWDLDDAPTGDGYNSHVSNSDNIAHSFHVEIWIDPIGDTDTDPTGGPILIIPYV